MSIDSQIKEMNEIAIKEEISYEQDISPNSKPLDSVNFARYIF